MNKQIAKNKRKARRKAKVRSIISGSSSCPRLSVYRSNSSIYLQLIDDKKGVTIASAHTKEIKDVKNTEEGLGNKEKISFLVGELIAKKGLEKKVKKVVFDRGSYLYHGRVKAAAEGARKGGLIF